MSAYSMPLWIIFTKWPAPSCPTCVTHGSPSATAAIDRLERAGFVRRVPNSHDRRGIIIEPVEGQQERLLSAYHQLRSRYAELIEGISDDELDVINRFLKGIERIELS